MSKRVIKLKLLTQTDLVKVETDARTLAEFKKDPQVEKLGINWSQAKLIDRASKASFDLDEAVLPAIDCLMFVTPTKTKSGADLPYKEVKEKIKNFKANGGVVDFNYTQATTAQLNEFWNKVSKNTAKPTVKQVQKVVEEVKKETLSKEIVKEVVKPSILIEDIAEVITKEQLDSEARSLKGRV